MKLNTDNMSYNIMFQKTASQAERDAVFALVQADGAEIKSRWVSPLPRHTMIYTTQDSIGGFAAQNVNDKLVEKLRGHSAVSVVEVDGVVTHC